MDVMSPDLVAEAESARTARVEVLTRAEPRCSWTAEQKREIVAESLGPDFREEDTVGPAIVLLLASN